MTIEVFSIKFDMSLQTSMMAAAGAVAMAIAIGTTLDEAIAAASRCADDGSRLALMQNLICLAFALRLFDTALGLVALGPARAWKKVP